MSPRPYDPRRRQAPTILLILGVILLGFGLGSLALLSVNL